MRVETHLSSSAHPTEAKKNASSTAFHALLKNLEISSEGVFDDMGCSINAKNGTKTVKKGTTTWLTEMACITLTAASTTFIP